MADCKENKEEKNGPSPPIIMKFDAPEESSENSANDEADGQSAEENSGTSHSSSPKSVTKIRCPVLAESKFGSSFGINEFSKSSAAAAAAAASPLKSAILRPSQLGTIISNSAGSSAQFQSESSKTSNPFLKVADEPEFDDESSKDTCKKVSECGNCKTPKPETNNKPLKAEETIAPKFIPLASSAKESDSSASASVGPNCSTPSFVFGQNLKARVTVTKDDEDSDNKGKEELKEAVGENGSSELLFSSAATVCRTTSRPGLTLTQAAQEIEEANRANKRKYSQVTPLTGEEGETNVLQINCKLFAFDKVASSWKERGRGTLRLNDLDDESRIVGRAFGTQRLILNTKIWPAMMVERAGPKSLRLTAMDVVGDVRIFLVQAAPAEIDQLYNLLMSRLKRAKERQPKKLATDH